jgi:pimeloyl-ACP methyl ester carboxylesterase
MSEIHRRDLLTAALSIVGLSATARAADVPCASSAGQSDIVLVHGAGHGGWCWGPAADQLLKQGYRVFRPTLTGLGDRRHLRSPDITLQTHIEDVVNLILAEELQNVCLVGHSYGGTVITGVCDELKERIGLVIFLDANTPNDGEPTIPNLSKERVEKMTGEPLLDGYLLPLMEPAFLGIDPKDTETTAWMRRQLTEQPIQTVTQPIDLQRGGTEGLARSFILATPLEGLRDWQREKVAAIARDPSWDYRELLVGHDAMIIAPCETAKLINELVKTHMPSART